MAIHFLHTKITDYYFPVTVEDGETVEDVKRVYPNDDQHAVASPPPAPRKPTSRHEKGPKLGKLFV